VRTVLIVDDEHGILVILDAVLGDAGYRTLLAGNGKQAIELFRTGHPDVVLMDWMMPIMDGPAAARAMRALRPDLPIVLMSGADERAVRQEYADYTAFLRKPFRAQAVLSAVEGALGGFT
jgi:CheY-like chemotaxis protein